MYDNYRFALSAHPGESQGGQLQSRALGPTMDRPSPQHPALSGLSSFLDPELPLTRRLDGNSDNAKMQLSSIALFGELHTRYDLAGGAPA